MIFAKFSNLEGKHALFSPSQPAWLNYSDEKAIEVYSNKKAAERGTALHAWAKETIDLGLRQQKSKKTLYNYVNDAIHLKMDTEVKLVYSERFYGTADAISFNSNFLRIHDLKTGTTPAHMEQLMIYAALFCLQYKYDPTDIKIELRIYQNDEIEISKPEPEEIVDIMQTIRHLDEILKEVDEVA